MGQQQEERRYLPLELHLTPVQRSMFTMATRHAIRGDAELYRGLTGLVCLQAALSPEAILELLAIFAL